MLSFPSSVISFLLQFVLVVHGVRVIGEGGLTGTVDKNVMEGSKPILMCSYSRSSAYAEGEAILEWTYKQDVNSAEEQLIVANGEVVYRPDHYALQGRTNLELKNIQDNESGIYTCFVMIPDDSPNIAAVSYDLTVLNGS